MASARQLLEEYVRSGKLMQVATLTAEKSPALCNVWYDAQFAPDALRFISRHDRHHSEHIRNDARVAGSIIAIPLDVLGQQVRGVTFAGRARELPCVGIDAEIEQFTRRWPASGAALERDALAQGETPIRLYEISVDEWVLFDEANFPEQPRQVIAGIAASRLEGAMPTFQMHHVALSVRDMAEAVRFYEQFGFRQVLHYEDSACAFEIAHLKLGDGFLELWHYADHVPAPETASGLATDLPRIGWKHLALRVESLDEASARLTEYGVPNAVAPRRGNTGVKYLFVKDPSGNLLEILEDNRDLGGAPGPS